MLKIMKKGIYEVSYQMKRELHHKIAIAVGIIFLFSFGMTLIQAFLVFPVRQRSVSMVPEINKGDCVIVSPLVTTPARGSVIILAPLYSAAEGKFRMLLDKFIGFFTFQQYVPHAHSSLVTETEQLRRVIGLPGDTIYMKDFVLYIKPADESHFLTEFELIDHPYNVAIETTPAMWEKDFGVCADFSPIVLGRDDYFVLADNRYRSVDSRLWGVVKKSRIKGKVLLSYFPFKDFKIFK